MALSVSGAAWPVARTPIGSLRVGPGPNRRILVGQALAVAEEAHSYQAAISSRTLPKKSNPNATGAPPAAGTSCQVKRART